MRKYLRGMKNSLYMNRTDIYILQEGDFVSSIMQFNHKRNSAHSNFNDSEGVAIHPHTGVILECKRTPRQISFFGGSHTCAY